MKAFYFLISAFLLLFVAEEQMSAQTIIPAKEDGSLSFAVMSDIHISVGAKSVEGTRECVKDINQNPDIQFVIISGDIANFGSDKELEVAKEIFDGFEKPWFIIAGNHDATWSESGTNSFLKTFGYERFEFTAGGIKFLGTQCGPNLRMAPALIPKESFLWLKARIEKMPDEQPLVFVNHYPIDTSLLKYNEVLDLLKKKNIQLILSGHWHIDKPMEYEGVPAAVIRSTLANKKGKVGYVIVDIKGSNISFRDKIVGENEPSKIWYTVRMSQYPAYKKEIAYPRPVNNFNEQYPDVKALWRVENPADIGCGAAYYKAKSLKESDIVIYADETGKVCALKAENGKELWHYKTEGKIFSTPAIWEELVIIGSTDSYIYAFNVKTGKPIWRYKCRKSVLGSPAIYKGIAYIGASDGSFRALRAKTGRLVWEWNKIGDFIESKPYVDDSQVVIGAWDNKLYSFEPKKGALQWVWHTPKNVKTLSPAQVQPVKAGGKIYIVTPDRYSYVLDAQSGEQIVRNYGGREAIGLSPDKTAYYVKCMKDTVRAYDTEAVVFSSAYMQRHKYGSLVKWQSITDFGYEIAPTPITSVGGVGHKGEGLLFIPTDKGNIYALNCYDGSIAFKHHLGGALVNCVTPIEGNRLLATTMDGIVAILQYEVKQ